MEEEERVYGGPLLDLGSDSDLPLAELNLEDTWDAAGNNEVLPVLGSDRVATEPQAASPAIGPPCGGMCILFTTGALATF